MDGIQAEALGAAAALGRAAGARGAGEALDAIAGAARTALGARAAAVAVASADGATAGRIHAAGDDRLMAHRDRPLLDLPGGRGEVPRWEGATVGMGLAHPSVRSGGREALLGVLMVAWDVPGRLRRAQREALRGLAAMAALALANARLEEIAARAVVAAERATALDPLTGLPGHRALHERVHAEALRAGRHGRPLALALLDLDGLGRVNADAGHRVGDGVIAETGRLLAVESRTEDAVARAGGGRFGWLMPETGEAAAWVAAERVRRLVGATAFPGAGPVTVAAGVCDLAAAGGPERLLALAETALRRAKSAGGDAVERLGHAAAPAGDGAEPSRRHAERMAAVACELAGALGWPAGRRARLREAAAAHDGGGALDPEQAAWIRGSRERWDGAGVPDGLAGDAIPEGARVLAVADAWARMTGERPWRRVRAPAEAAAELGREAGLRYDPEVVAALGRVGALRRRRAV
jgi:diguanylate cyclase (GGDEF)-like protein